MERHHYIYDLNINGGGHGNSNALWGAGEFFHRRRTNAIVTASDDGFDSGKLISAYHVDSPGDRRMCAMPLAAPETQPENNQLAQYRFTRQGLLSDYTIQELTVEILNHQHETPKKGEIAFRRIFGIPLTYFNNGCDSHEELKELMQFRFPESIDGKKVELGLDGRCYGNLTIAACELICKDSDAGFEMFRKIFSIQGDIAPVTKMKHPVLHGELENGQVICGESNIGSRDKQPDYDPRVKMCRVYHDGDLNPKADYFLKNSFLRAVGPGSPETSVVPVLVTRGYAEALEEANALGGRTVVIPSIMNGEGTLFKDAAEVIEYYLSHLNGKRRLVTDVILSSTGFPIHGERRYAEYGQTKIDQNPRGCQILLPHARIHLVEGLIDYDMTTGRVGHNARLLGEALYKIWQEAA